MAAHTKSNYPWMDVRFNAVSNTEGIAVFSQVVSNNKELTGCSSMGPKEDLFNHPDLIAVNNIEVPMTTMEKILENIPGVIDVVKVDTEGYTWEVLEGFGPRLHDVKVFHLETERDPNHEGHHLMGEITGYMTAKGFALVDVSYEWGWGIQDQVWVNKALAQYHTEVFRAN
jgi:FkbM family methyltransferase